MPRTMTTYHTRPSTRTDGPRLLALLTSSHKTAAEAVATLALLNPDGVVRFTVEACTNAGCLGCHGIRERARDHRAWRRRMAATYGPRAVRPVRRAA